MNRRMWIVIVPFVLFIMLAISIKAKITAGFEGWVYNEAVEGISPTLTNIVKSITHMGDPIVVILFVCCF